MPRRRSSDIEVRNNSNSILSKTIRTNKSISQNSQPSGHENLPDVRHITKEQFLRNMRDFDSIQCQSSFMYKKFVRDARSIRSASNSPAIGVSGKSKYQNYTKSLMSDRISSSISLSMDNSISTDSVLDEDEFYFTNED